MAIDQRYTKWVKKEGKRGYVIDTRTGKRVTGNVKLVTNTTKGKAGEVQSYKKGVGGKTKPTSAGAGQQPGAKPKPAARPATRPAARPTGSGSGGSSNPTPAPTRMTAADRRRSENAAVPNGTIRKGAKGRGVRRYNEKTGRWDRVTGATGATTTSSQSQRPTRQWPGDRPRPSASGSASAASTSRARGASGSASARVVSPASVAGVTNNARRTGDAISNSANRYANMGKTAAASLLAKAEAGKATLSAAQKRALQRIVKGY